MQLLDEAPVLESEIDSLGHMNVRHYLGRVDRANNRLLAECGLKASQAGTVIRRIDTYSRFHKEQFSGCQLQVMGGFLASNQAQVRCYFEIRNAAKDQVAATFIISSSLVNSSNDKVLSFPSNLSCLLKTTMELPDHGRPRSLSLAPPRMAVTLAELEASISDNQPPGMMSGKREAMVMAEDCDNNGRVSEDVDLMFIMHRSQASEPARSHGPPVMKTTDGNRFSFAMIETRALVFGRPGVGDQLVSIGADVAFGERWRQSRRWAFVRQTGALVGINDVVGIALDLDARRSIPIPEAIRADLSNNYLPDLL